MLRLLISQRVNSNCHGLLTDVLESSLTKYFNSLGIIICPVSNFLDDVELYLEGIQYNGLILSGGGDVNPRFVDMKTNQSINYSPERDKCERNLISKMISLKMPTLGICYGMQQLNCYYGGRVTASIHCEEKQSRKPGLNHSINIEKNVFGLSGKYDVNHFHDNVIKNDQVASNFDIFAVDSDYDVVEGIIHKDLPIVGINWHPERDSPDDEFNKQLIKEFFGT
jgi:putative glutamine amidotransferase